MGARRPLAAVILAGGAGRRLGGPHKPELPVAGTPMRRRVTDAAVAAGADPVITVGGGADHLPGAAAKRVGAPPGAAEPATTLLLTTCEEPPGGGPAAATAAGIALLSAGPAGRLGRVEVADGAVADGAVVDRAVALLAADLPLLVPEALRRLHDAVTDDDGYAGAVFTDHEGRPQWLCGVWRTAALRRQLACRSSWAGAPLRTLLSPLPVRLLRADPDRPPPWWDCDTEADRRRAEEWAT